MTLTDSVSQPDDSFFDEEFMVMIDSHLTWLRSDPDGTMQAISNIQAYKWEGDLFGLLDNLGIDKRYHFIIARVNYYENSTDYRGDVYQLFIPTLSNINMLNNIYKTTLA